MHEREGMRNIWTDAQHLSGELPTIPLSLSPSLYFSLSGWKY